MTPENKKPNNALRYSGMGFQIVGVFALGFYIGYKVDQWLATGKPYFTVLFSLIFLVAGLYLGLRGFLRKQ